jgi:outer membrane protein assembly factor BamB
MKMTARKITERKVAALGLFCVVLLLLINYLTPLLGANANPAKPADWFQFRGPKQDGVCGETDLLKTWPDGGAKLLWKMAGLGTGLSSVSISNGRLFTVGDLKPSPELEDAQYVMAFDLASQKRLWAAKIGPRWDDTNGGPRCVPTIDGDLAYAISTEGDIVCMESATGNVRWRKNFVKDFGGLMMSRWKFSESPLVDGDKVVCTPGGKNATIVALNKKTGETIWQFAVPNIGSKGGDGAGYSSIVAANIDGVRQYVQLLGRGVVGVAADSGKFLWGYNRIASNAANITQPIVKDNYVFTSNGYNSGSALVKIAHSGDQWNAEEVYFISANDFQNHHGGMVLMGDYVYSGHGMNAGAPVCIELMTGKIAWKAKAPDSGSACLLGLDGDRLIYRWEKGGLVALVEANPKEFKIVSSFKPAVNDGPAWPYPVVQDGKLYLRSQDALMCYDVRNN